MSRDKTLSFSLVLFFFIGLQAQASLFDAHSLRNTIMNAHAATSGIVEITRDYSTGDYYVEADLSYYPYSSSNSSNTTNSTSAAGTVKMMLSIVNEETMVASNCLSFSHYNCSQYSSCHESSFSQTIDFPTFTAYANYAQADMYLDYYHWSMSSAYMYIAQSCQTTASHTTGYGRYGVIGLGNDGAAKIGVTASTVFSINIASNLNGGTLMFKNDASNIARSTVPDYTLSANSTWQVRISSGSIKFGSFAVTLSGNLMFDVNFDAIGLPYGIFQSFIYSFTRYSGAHCASDLDRPTCSYTGKLENLPDIILSLDGTNLKIPSRIYATQIPNSSFYLNFRATNSSLSGSSHVSPSFQNSIILGSRFMSYYYTVFDVSSGYNYIYIYNLAINPIVFRWWTGAGIAGAIFIVGIIFCCCCKKKRTIPNNNTIVGVNNTTDIVYNNTTQAPLIYNQQGTVAAPNYSYDTNIYNYQGYNTQPQPQGVYNVGYQQPQAYAAGHVQPQAAPSMYPQGPAQQ